MMNPAESTATPNMELAGAVVLLSVIMPAYNEEDAIERVILGHVTYLERLRHIVPEWEIVCVDDGSTDSTPEILRSLQLRIPRLRVIRQENQGIFGALSRGHREARGSHFYCTSSDGQFPPENLGLMLARVRSGAQLVVGVRTNRREVYSLPRRIISLFFNLLPSILFGVTVKDAGSDKLGLRDVFRFNLISRSPFFEAERIICAHRAGFRVDFVPIRFLTRSSGKAKGASWKNIRTSASDLVRCLCKYGFR
jgi:dolichol-phosphate mannosyltransferase